VRDPFMEVLGIEVEALGPDAARLALTVRPEHRNLHGTAHGGLLYALADAGRKVASYRVRLLADDRLVAQFVGTVFHLEGS